eukprot:TRINITY_DN12146_c0_g1_i1.p1 TRINITY_DN12146_c0_g1~~TRINITY_DN12146_c0_g1_i1.p1  ORF type:complete len:576 (+),score=95.18 TRINITY_DN12146_c0_g1_i1:102-1829(+)
MRFIERARKALLLKKKADGAEVLFFDTVTWNVIVCILSGINCVGIGVEFELEALGVAHVAIGVVGTLNYFIGLVFVTEVFLRVLHHGRYVVQHPLTLLDLVVVTSPLIQYGLGHPTSLKGMVSLRMLRLYILGDGHDKAMWRWHLELYYVSRALQRPLCVLAWMSMLAIPIFACAALLCQRAIGESAAWNETRNPLEEYLPFVTFDNVEYFGSVENSLLTLVQIATVSQWAPHIARPVVNVYPMSLLFFLFFTFATTFGLTMAVVGVFTQATLAEARHLDKAKEQDNREGRMLIGRRLTALIEAIDQNGDGELSAEEIDTCLADFPEFEDHLKELGLHYVDGNAIVQMFDKSGEGLVSYEEFLDGIVSLGDHVTPRYFAWLSLRVWTVQNRINYLSSRMDAICAEVQEVSRSVKQSFAVVADWSQAKQQADIHRQAVRDARAGIDRTKTPEFVRRFREKPPEVLLPDAGDHVKQMWLRYFPELLHGKPETRQAHAMELPGVVLDSGEDGKVTEHKASAESSSELMPAMRSTRGFDPPWLRVQDVTEASAERNYTMRNLFDVNPHARMKWIRDQFP